MLDIFCDSGAFTFFNNGQKTSLKEYHMYIKKHKHLLANASSMDVITSWKKSFQYFLRLKKTGIDYVPCYHFGEPTHVLKEYMKHADFISIGGMVPISYQELLPWLDTLFSNIICNEDGTPKIKTHGFGLTDQRLMFRYPWYSVDSSTWLRVSRMGMILTPRTVNGKVRWDKQPIRIQVSDKGPMKNGQDSHIYTMGEVQQNKVKLYIKEKGFELGETEGGEVVKEGLCNSFRLRDKFNMLYMIELESHLPEWPSKLNIRKQRVFI